MNTKVDMVKSSIQSGDYKKALSIVKGFKMRITKEQHNVMLRAYECMVHPAFYKSIGIDLNKAIEEGVMVLKSIYG